jgi:signal transduction histidine kinase
MRALFFSASPWRTILETLVLNLALYCLLFILYVRVPYSRQDIIGFMLPPLAMLWCALRLCAPGGTWWRKRGVEAVVYISMSAVLICLLVSLQYTPFIAGDRSGRTIAEAAAIVFFLNCVVFIVARMGWRLLLFWNRLRRTQLLWSLTHAHLMLVVLATGLLIVVMDLMLIVSNHYQYQGALIFPATIGLAMAGIFTIGIVLPPSLLFSFLVIRGTSRRLRELAAATSALRRKDYSARVPIVGEDEVAQLQMDFNAMAAELEQAMYALQEERDRVTRLLQLRRELVANVSHELRTPVATMRGYLETTLMRWDETSPAAVHHNLHVMEDEVLHLQSLVEDLFALSRAEVGRLALQCKPTDAGGVVSRVVEANAPLVWQKSKIDLVADVSPQLPYVLIDAQHLEQALQNLLHNGARHTAPGGIIAVAVTLQDSTLGIHVKDTGEGIAPEDLPHIWERFYQTTRTRSRKDGGAGLGLALVKEWIEAMGGTVAVQSVLGEGTCFSLFFPLPDPSSQLQG